MKSKLYNLPFAGDILVCKHPQSKKLSIKIKPNSIPKVIIPTLMPYDMGFRFAKEKENWIVEHIEKLSKIKPEIIRINEETGFKTRFHQINIRKFQGKNLLKKQESDNITLFFPEQNEINSENSQLLIKKFIIEVLRSEAKHYLPKRLNTLAEKYGFTYNKIFIKNMKSRWGSCSGKNNINLNLHLMRLPEHLSDFIILHELCHTIHKNHGTEFHKLLNKLVGNEKELNKQLKKYSTLL